VNDEAGDAVGFAEESFERAEVPAEVAGWVVGDRVDDDAPVGEIGETRRWGVLTTRRTSPSPSCVVVTVGVGEGDDVEIVAMDGRRLVGIVAAAFIGQISSSMAVS
jgi:hypothetical protein